MSKAEERANERYPLMQDGDEEGLEALKYVGMECGSIYEYNSIKYAQQAYFIEGYHQAEKDIKEELSKLFREFMMDCVNDSTDTHILHFVEVFNNKIKEIGNE